VLDEKMGEEVKITVIATGFRDQMPERRARMLSVEETPVVSVPVVVPSHWMSASEPEPAVGPARFLSEAEESATESADNGFFFASAAPGVATTVTVAEELTKTDADYAKEYGMEGEDAPEEPQFESPGADPQPVLSRDYAADFTQTQHETTETAEPAVQTAPSLFAGPEHQTERDLDVPTFLRRLKF
jgi:cell division protein FtsZ